MLALPARRRLPLTTVLTYVLVVGLAILYAFPFYWMVVISIKHITELDTIPPTLIPLRPTPQNYADALLQPGAYGFARIPFKGRNVLFVLVLATMMVPESVLLIPQYLLFKTFGWLDSLLPLIVPRYFGTAFFIFLLRQFFMTIPRELDEAALIDGANHFQIFWWIMLPLSGPILVTVFALSFVELWNDFFGPLIYLNSQSNMVVAVALRLFAVSGMQLPIHLLMAASVVNVLPVIIVFLVCQRYFIRSIALTGLKG